MTTEFNVVGSDERLRLEPQALVIAGFTARDQAKAQAHIDELRAQGIPCPARIPTFYPVPMSLLTSKSQIDVASAESSGEVEPVLVAHGKEWYVALGSDHTARDLEKIDIAESKAACPKVISIDAWRLADVRDHWDRIVLRSWVVQAGERIAYQQGMCADILPPEAIVALMQERGVCAANDFVMYMGTLPLLTGKFVFGPRFELELNDPVLGRTLFLAYDVRVQETSDAKA